MTTITANRTTQSDRWAKIQDVLDAPPNNVTEAVDGIRHLTLPPASKYACVSSGIGVESPNLLPMAVAAQVISMNKINCV